MLGVRGGGGGGASWLDESQMTVASAIQCRYPTKFDLEKSTFYLEKKSHLKKVSWFLSLSLSLSPPLSEVCSSFILALFQIPTFLSFSSFFFRIPHSLQEADRPDVDSKLLVRSTNIHGSNVHDGETRGLLRSVLDHRLAPLARVFLCFTGEIKDKLKVRRPLSSAKLQGMRLTRGVWVKKKPNSVCSCAVRWICRSHRASVLHHAIGEAAVALGSDLHVVGALQQHGLLQVPCRGVHVGHAVLTVVGEVLSRLGGEQSQEGHLNGSCVGRQAVVTVAELLEVAGRGRRRDG